MNRQRQRKRQWKSWSLGDVGGDGDSGDCSDNAERKLSRESLDGRDDPTRRRERERPTIGFVAGATDSRRDNDSTGSRPRHRGHPKSLSSSYTAGEDRSAGLPQRRHGKVSSSFTAGCEHHSLDNFKDPSAEDFRASAAAERAGRWRPSHTCNSSRSLFSLRSENSGGSAATDLTASIAASQRQLDSSLRRLSLDDDGGRPSGLRSRDAKADEEAYIRETERKFKGEAGFEEHVIGEAKDLESSIRLLRQTRAISALGSRLTAASDEDACVEEVARLLVLMFGVESVSFDVPTDPEHFLSKRIDVVRTNADDSSFDLRHSDGDGRRRLEGTAEGACIRSLREHYAPRTGDSPFEAHAALHRDGMNAALATPVLVDAGRCAGCIVLAREAEDGFGEAERALIGDVGALLGANIHAKRLLKDAEETKRRSREMLHSFCHPKVLKKIECYWDADSDEYKSRKSASSDSPEEDASMTADSTGSIASDDDDDGKDPHLARSEWTDADVDAPQRNGDGPAEGGVKEKIRLWKSMEGAGDGGGEDDALMFDTSAMDFAPTSRALYAESAENVCIVFTDIVGFSKMDITPTKIMDMLQNLFNRFDELCDVHGVMKSETIGDAYVCATNLLDDVDDDDDDDAEDAAIRALAMAKDMISEATNVKIPFSGDAEKAWTSWDTLQIRVGIHIGDVTCGVLGQRLPKLTICGRAVNMAARMEQNSQPSCIRVTKDFHDVVGDAEKGWKPKEVIPLKNMGDMETYLLDPLEIRIGELIDCHQACPYDSSHSTGINYAE